MHNLEWFQELLHRFLGPGTWGSLAALLWMKDPWPRKVCMFFAGALLSSYATEDIAKMIGLDLGFAGFLVGLFGMAIVARMFEFLATFNIYRSIDNWVSRRLGIPPSEPQERTNWATGTTATELKESQAVEESEAVDRKTARRKAKE